MGTRTFDEIAGEVIGLLDRQMESITGRNFNDLPRREKLAYENRRRRILELRSALTRLQRPH
ncbi:MAG: hypothetical protein WBS24_08350 [Terriglobales bacterium]